MVVVVAAVIICGAVGATLILGNGDQDVSGEFSIEYVLDGGTLSDDSPSSYNSGEITELGSATKQIEDSEDNYVFLGWYLDEDLTQNIRYIPSSMRGNIKLYASWSADGSGAQEFFNTTTVTIQDSFFGKQTTTTTGTYDRTYLTYDEEKETYLEMISYSSTDALGRTSSSTVTRWQTSIDTDQDDEDLQLEPDTLVLGDRTISCESVSFTYTYGNYKVSETRYFIYGWAMIYSVAEYKSSSATITETFELRSLGTYQNSDTYEIKAYTDMGITVTDSGVYDAYSTGIVLTATAAEGTTFAGWYDEGGNLLSSSPTYTVDLLMSDITVYAYNTESKDAIAERGETIEFSMDDLTGIMWEIYNSDNELVKVTSDDSFTMVFDDCGSFVIKLSGTDASGTKVYRFYGMMVDSTVTRTYEWSYNGVDYEYTLNILYSDFYAYRSDVTVGRSSQMFNNNTILNTQTLITSSDKYVVELAGMLEEKTEGMSAYDKINVLLAFTQYIEYVSDETSMGQAEYWKYPLETLYDNNGDCEDTSILFAAIGKAMGFDTAVMLFPGHATGAVNFEDLGMSEDDYEISYQQYGSFFNSKIVYSITYDEKTQYLYVSNNKGYLYCETTVTEDDNGMQYTVGVDPYAGNKQRNPTSETYSPYNMTLLIPTADTE